MECVIAKVCSQRQVEYTGNKYGDFTGFVAITQTLIEQY